MNYETGNSRQEIALLQAELAELSDEFIDETTANAFRSHEVTKITIFDNGVVLETRRGVATNYNTDFEVERTRRSIRLFGRVIGEPRTTYTLTSSTSSISGWPHDPTKFEPFTFTKGVYKHTDIDNYQDFKGRLNWWLEFDRRHRA